MLSAHGPFSDDIKWLYYEQNNEMAAIMASPTNRAILWESNFFLRKKWLLFGEIFRAAGHVLTSPQDTQFNLIRESLAIS